jgi:hypothetical protein
MCDIDERDAEVGLEPLELELHLAAQLEIHRAERLVEQEYPRAVDEGARQGDSLLLAARQLAWGPNDQLGQAYHFQRARHALPALGRGHPPHAEPVLDILPYGHMREERVVLKDLVEVSPVGRQPGDRGAVHQNLAGTGLLEPG